MTGRRVLKIGGSLLSRPDFADVVADWLRAQPPAQNLAIIGGGAAIDAMRELAERFRLDETAMHWRCVRLLRATYEIAGELFPQWQRIDGERAFAALAAAPPRAGHWLLAVDAFYSPATHAGSGLPAGWQTTTDSLAAYLARRTHADELVLLKSCTIPPRATVAELSAAGIVDEAFQAALPPGPRLRMESLPPREG